jgi:glucose/arabinose dehydrogenase
VLGYREEIFAYGLRNPWRLSFDPDTGWLWVGDVGQVTFEEVNVVESGRNYGWDCREGYRAYQPANERSPMCAGADDFAPPAWVYGRDEGQSITGGYVYRGSRLGELTGWYIYADYALGRVWALFYDGQRVQNRLLTDTDLLISSLGVSSSGDLYFCEHDPDGGETKIYRLASSGK